MAGQCVPALLLLSMPPDSTKSSALHRVGIQKLSSSKCLVFVFVVLCFFFLAYWNKNMDQGPKQKAYTN